MTDARSMCPKHVPAGECNERDGRDVLTLDALPLAMAMTHSVTRAAKRINDEPEA